MTRLLNLWVARRKGSCREIDARAACRDSKIGGGKLMDEVASLQVGEELAGYSPGNHLCANVAGSDRRHGDLDDAEVITPNPFN